MKELLCVYVTHKVCSSLEQDFLSAKKFVPACINILLLEQTFVLLTNMAGMKTVLITFYLCPVYPVLPKRVISSTIIRLSFQNFILVYQK